MKEKDIIQKLQSLRQIKPNQDWANWLKAHILEVKPQSGLYNKPRIKLAIFSFIPKYQKTLVPSLLAVFLICSFAFAQTTLPGSVLYPIKTLTQNTKIYLASENTKPVVRLETAKAKMEDLSKVENHKKEIIAVAKDIGKDLEIVPEEIKKINQKQIALDVSKDVQEKSKDLKAMVDKIPLEDKEKEELNKSVENYQSQVLALIIGTTDEINQCPSYLKDKLLNLGKYFTNEGKDQWSLDDVIKSKDLLLEASDAFKAGDCLTAMEKIESINKLLTIHSLDVQVETSTPESLDQPDETLIR